MSSDVVESAEIRGLLADAAAGDVAAVDKLMALHRPELVRFVGLRLDQRLRSRVDASDVVQEAQMEAARRLPDYMKRQPMPFGVWLRRTAYERLLMLRRRHLGASRRDMRCELPLPDHSSIALAEHLMVSNGSPGSRLAKQEAAEMVRRAIGKLPNRDREVLLMHTFEGASYEEIGFLFRLSVEAAKKRHGRALLRLHKLLLESGLSGSLS